MKTDKILLVDDEQDILEFLSYNLRKEGYTVETCQQSRSAITKAKEFQPDLIILDVMMPEMDGVELCMEIRKQPELKHVLIAFLTARNEDYSHVAGLDAGADDYIPKPIKPRVLLSRINSMLRRKSIINEQIENAAGLHLDTERYLVIKDGQEIVLPRKEFELLQLLLSVPQKVFQRDEILNQVWGSEVVVGDRTIDVHVRRIREKLGDDCIITVKGVGYKYMIPK